MVAEGTLPPGLSLRGDGRLAGMPSANGAYSFKVCASNGFAPKACRGFSVNIGLGAPTIAGKASAGGPVGTAARDVATLSGGSNPTGSVTFKLFSDATCSTQVFTSTVNLSGNSATSASFTPTAPGKHYWTAAYSGDARNNGVSSPCGAPNQSVTISKATPTLTGKASSGGPRGTPVRDVATLAGGSNPTGKVTFRLYSDAGCATQVFVSTKNLAGLTATSDPFTPTNAGTYRWRATYTGDARNNAVTTACGAANQSVDITPTVAPPSERTLTGEVAGEVVVGPGETVKLVAARVGGKVTVTPGGALEVTGSELRGGLAAEIPASVKLCGSQVLAPSGAPALEVWGAVGAVRIGDPAAGCAGNRIVGDAILSFNPDLIVATNGVSGALTVDGNGPDAVVVKGNQVGGVLACSANDPAPANGGMPNNATTKTGQCTTV